MPLKLILGPANSAKAGAVLDAYRAASRRDALLVVPSHADAVHYDRELTAHGTSLGRALTFPRLIEEIALRSGYEARKLSPLQRELVVARARARHTFTAFSGSAASPGFTLAAGRLLAELRGAHIEPPRFAAALRQWDRSDFADDLAALYLGYARAVERTGMVDEQQYAWGALDALRERPQRWGATPVFFYGFDDLTDAQLDAVRTLAQAVGVGVTVSLTFEQDRVALKGRAEVAAELQQFAAEIEDMAALDDHYDEPSRAALHQLERFLFESADPIAPGEAVRLIEAGGALAEAEQVAAEVLAALRDGVPPGEIVVIARSLAGSGQLLERTLTRYGAPVHSDRLVPLGHTRLGRAVLALAHLAWDEDRSALPATELFAALRAAAAGPVDHDLLDRFEATLRRSGIATAAQALAHPDLRLLRGGALGELLAQIVALAASDDPRAQLQELVYTLLQRAGDGAARAAATILGALRELRELDGERITPAADLLLALDSLELTAVATPESESVLVAEPLQVRARRFRRVFVTGLCDGEFPGSLTTANPFLDDERRFEIAIATGLRMPRLEEPLQRERYLLYACVSRATERVVLSYRTSDEEGKLELPSPFLADVRSLFTEELFERRLRRPLSDVTWSIERAPTVHEHELASAAAAGDATPSRAVEVLADGMPAETPGAARTRWLSAEALAHVHHTEVVSAGALVKFHSCPVRWLVENQLRPEDLDPESDPLARGDYMHRLLERTLRALGTAVTDMSLDEALALLRRFGAEEDHRLAPGHSPEVRAAVRDGVLATLERFLRETATASGRWQPTHFETRFGVRSRGAPDGLGAAVAPGPGARAEPLPPLELRAAGESIRVSGTIDRVDVDRGSPAHAVVRDYKSGSSGAGSRARASWLSDGEIQVAIYMLAAERLLNLKPVAGLYQPLSGRELRPRGVFERSLGGLGATYDNDGVDAELLDELLADAEALAVELGTAIKRGELTPRPKTCSGDGCRYPWICWAR